MAHMEVTIIPFLMLFVSTLWETQSSEYKGYDLMRRDAVNFGRYTRPPSIF
jgi:hypothetical protein